jgi:tetratricopeptide (TPR) repeat protein
VPNGQPEAYVMMCLVHGAWERALEVMEELGPLPAYAPQLAVAAGRLAQDGDAAGALRLATRALELNPSCAMAHSVLGLALALQGEAAAAEESLRRAVDMDANELAARVALANIYQRQGRPLDAAPLIEETLRAAPFDEGAREALKRLRKSVEASVGRKHPTAAVLHKLAAQVQQRHAVAEAPPVTLCLITKNEEENLPRVIESVRGLVTEIIVVDTGSTDNTVAVAERLGARVHHFTWINDFAAARNYSLSLATGEWILVMDADDEFPRESIPSLCNWLSHAPPLDVVGLYRRYPYPGMERDAVTVVPWLFRNGKGLHFRHAIHETLCTAEGESARPAHVLTVTIFHHGIDGTDAVLERRARNLPMLLRALESKPDDIRMLFYVGMTYLETGDHNESIAYLQRVIELTDRWVDVMPKSYACIGHALRQTNRLQASEAMVREGLRWYPEYPELWICLGYTLDALGRLEEAVEAHERALRGRFGPSMNWHNWSAREHLPHLALCDLRLSLGDPEAASRHLAAAEEFTGPRPGYDAIREGIEQTIADRDREAAERECEVVACEERFAAGERGAGLRLLTALLAGGETQSAADFLARWEQSDSRTGGEGESPERQVARGRLRLAQGETVAAYACFVAARQADPGCAAAWRGEADALRALDRAVEAEEALLRALALDAQDGAAARSLGEFCLHEQRWADAVSWFQHSLERRDDVWSTWLGLGTALLRTGNLPHAIQAYQRAATLSEGNATVRVALGEARAYLTQAGARAA